MMKGRKTTLVLPDSNADDAVSLMKKVAQEYKNSEAINKVVSLFPMDKYKNPLDWFKAVFAYIYEQCDFESDAPGKEQIKSPDRFLLKDKKGDCDCHTTFWMSLLMRLKIRHTVRIVKYKSSNSWAHVYPVVLYKDINTGAQKELILDNVFAKLRGGLKKFNKEVPHTEQKNFN